MPNNKQELNSGLKFILELGPLVLFFIAYRKAGWIIENISIFNGLDPEKDKLYPAILIIIITSIISLIIYRVKLKYFPIMPLISTLFATLFGVLAFIFRDSNFIKMKVTIAYLLPAIILIIGLWLKKPFIKYIFGEAFELPEAIWIKLTERWVMIFLALAVLNEYIWRNFSTDFWVSFKVFATPIILIIFTLSQLPLIIKNKLND